MKKRKIGIFLLAFLLCLWGNYGKLYAWFTDQDEKKNLFSVGNNEVEIEEEFPESQIIPDKEIEKTVEFTNTGKVPCYVRAKYYFSSDDAEEHTTIIFGSEKWKKGSHDFYYYQDSIVPGEKTEPFITAVKIKKEGENLESFDLNIYTETMQSENHSSAEEAFGMFEKEGEGYET